MENRNPKTGNGEWKEASDQMKGDDIAARLVGLAVMVVKIVDGLPDTLAGRHVAGQPLRSGTSPGANAWRRESARFSSQAGNCAERVAGNAVLAARRRGSEVGSEPGVAGAPRRGGCPVRNTRNIKAYRYHQPRGS